MHMEETIMGSADWTRHYMYSLCMFSRILDHHFLLVDDKIVLSGLQWPNNSSSQSDPNTVKPACIIHHGLVATLFPLPLH